MGKERLEKMLHIVERNKQYQQELEQKLEKKIGEIKDYLHDDEEEKEITAHDVKIVLFAAESPFSNSFIEMCMKKTVLTSFDDAEKALEFCLRYRKKNLILDMDTPTDPDAARDLFTTMKTARPDTNIFLCTNRSNSREVMLLNAKEGIILKKPLFYKDIEHFIKEYIE